MQFLLSWLLEAKKIGHKLYSVVRLILYCKYTYIVYALYTQLNVLNLVLSCYLEDRFEGKNILIQLAVWLKKTEIIVNLRIEFKR